MGDALIERKWARYALLGALLFSTTLSAVALFPYTKGLLSNYSVDYYDYRPARPVESEIDTASIAPAIAVPILMYHGVTPRRDAVNTTVENFIKQMELLKREGYETITLDEYDRFRRGEFTLPPLPVIITFDDGRKDSFYTTDDILRTLGFRATMFYASGPVAEGNSFYLTWEEMRQVKETGRWEIEAHAKYAHERVSTGLSGEWSVGSYLMSKIHNSHGGLESDEEFMTRVENDYVQNIEELKRELSVDARYFAIPLNDYGQHHVYNNDIGTAFNRHVLEKYFELAFIQVNSPEDVTDIHLPVYNFAHDDPYRMRRIEMMNMDAEELLAILKRERPTEPRLSYAGEEFAFARHIQSSPEGAWQRTDVGMVVEAQKINDNGKIAFGQPHWENYRVEASMRLDQGESIGLVFNYQGSDDLITFGISGVGFYMRSTVDGVTNDIQEPIPDIEANDGFNTYVVEVKDGSARALYNGVVIYDAVSVPLSYGGVGIKVWGKSVLGRGTLQSIRVTPL